MYVCAKWCRRFAPETTHQKVSLDSPCLNSTTWSSFCQCMLPTSIPNDLQYYTAKTRMCVLWPDITNYCEHLQQEIENYVTWQNSSGRVKGLSKYVNVYTYTYMWISYLATVTCHLLCCWISGLDNFPVLRLVKNACQHELMARTRLQVQQHMPTCVRKNWAQG